MSQIKYLYNQDTLSLAADWLYSHFGSNHIIAFIGEMGAGKTTLISTLCKNLGVVSKTSSPSYTIVNEYITKDQISIYHFDFYRITNEDEAINIGVYDYFDSGNLCLIEWPENIYNILSNEQVLYIEINKTLLDNQRELVIKN